MAGLFMNMGLGGSGAYSGPVFGSDGPSAVPATQGYPDTASAALLFGPAGMTGGGGRNPAAHGLAFGLVCFGLLIFVAWALPR